MTYNIPYSTIYTVCQRNNLKVSYMRSLALSDEILLQVEKPARYIGNEVNSVMKDPEQVAIRFATCFPDVMKSGCPIWDSDPV